MLLRSCFEALAGSLPLSARPAGSRSLLREGPQAKCLPHHALQVVETAVVGQAVSPACAPIPAFSNKFLVS